MPRLSRDVVAAREKLTRDMFAAGKSADEVQKALQAGWDGMKMAPGRLAELQQEAKGTIQPVITAPATVTLVNPLSSSEPMVVEADSGSPVDSSEGDAAPFASTADSEESSTKTYNPAADGFLDFAKAKAKARGHVIVDVSEEIYEEWLATLG